MKSLVLAVAALAGMLAPSIASADSQEQQIGQKVYAELQQKGEIIARPNALYDVLDPIAARIKRVADPQYDYPFNFILVHEKSPNAFAVPGGNVYVTDSLMTFVQNREELAGVLCHETSHDIHHDVVNNMTKDELTGLGIGIIGSFLGLDRSGVGRFTENVGYMLGSTHFSRMVESAADHKGAQTCAEAGSNPWGMIWLFQNFEKADTGGSMEFLSDHPNNEHRIVALKKYFASAPNTFGRFSSNIALATPLHVSKTLIGPYVSPSPTAQSSSNYCCAPTR